MTEAEDSPIDAVAALGEPTRRRLYDLVVRSERPMGRDAAAERLGLTRSTAAFHLDRLVAEGLLDVVFERRTGRTGPGAGRPAKLYRRSDHEVTVTLPGRRYDLAGSVLADALEEAERSGDSPRTVLIRRAHETGRSIGRAARSRTRPSEGALATVLGALEEQDYEPRVEDASVRLANCPFHTLAARHTELVCGMNLALLEGVLSELGDGAFAARLAPGEGRCCVVLEPQPPVAGD